MPAGRANASDVIAERAQIVGMWRAGATVPNIALEMGRSTKTIRRWIRRWEEEGSVETRPRSGRPRVTSARMDAMIVAAATAHPKRTSVEHTRDLGLNCHHMTTRRRLHEAGINCYIPAHKGWLTPTNKESRLGFALEHLPHTEEYWRSVIYTDETVFRSVGAEVRQCWRPPNTRYHEKNIQHRAVSGRVSVPFWGWMWAYGPGELVRINGRFTSEQYVEILEQVLIPTVRAMAVPFTPATWLKPTSKNTLKLRS